MKAAGKSKVDIKLSMPIHTQREAIIRMDCNVLVGGFNREFRYERSRPIA